METVSWVSCHGPEGSRVLLHELFMWDEVLLRLRYQGMFLLDEINSS